MTTPQCVQDAGEPIVKLFNRCISDGSQEAEGRFTSYCPREGRHSWQKNKQANKQTNKQTNCGPMHASSSYTSDVQGVLPCSSAESTLSISPYSVTFTTAPHQLWSCTCRGSKKIKLEQGARQGDNISPMLCIVCLRDAIISEINWNEKGIKKEKTVSTFPTWSSPMASSWSHSLHKNCN